VDTSGFINLLTVRGKARAPLPKCVEYSIGLKYLPGFGSAPRIFVLKRKKEQTMAVNLITGQIQFIFMKKFFGLVLLVLVLVAVSGCTQTTKPSAPATTVPTTVLVTEIPTTLTTPEQTTIPVTTVVTEITIVETPMVTKVGTPVPSMTPSTKITTIHIRNNSFVPAVLTVLPGTGITWINDDSVSHVVKASGKSAGKFTSATMVSGARFGYTFGETTGTYEYTDPGFAGMNGSIIIANGAAVVGAPAMQSASP
jgi:plastocyanin